jgi:hypothetical protein
MLTIKSVLNKQMPSSPERVKFFMYLLFFMLGFVVSIIIVTNANLSINYAWIPFVTSTAIVTLLILLFDKDEVSLRSVLLAAASSVVGALFFALFGSISAVLLAFQGLASLLGLGGAAAGAAVVAAVPLAVAIAADPAAAIASRESYEEDYEKFSGGRRRRGGRKFLWKW